MYEFDVFISYTNSDKEFARSLVTWLRNSGFKVWFDEEQLVPGSRFRTGLEQGIKESQHLISILTEEYIKRKWTQREIDIFDISASDESRRILGIYLLDENIGVLDQVFQVHQRIPWKLKEFDAEAFWLVYCGLKNERPGRRDRWIQNSKTLFDKKTENIKKEKKPELNSVSNDVAARIRYCLLDDSANWKQNLLNLATSIRRSERLSIIERFWGFGHSEISAVIALLFWPKIHRQYSAWSFIDLCLPEISQHFLLLHFLRNQIYSEMYFSWAISEKNWEFLHDAARYAPEGVLRNQFLLLAEMANSSKSFTQLEEEYDYSKMITPWNHFHLIWLSLKLNDFASAKSHAIALCKNATSGDRRAGRFINRMTNWNCFLEIVSDKEIISSISEARSFLGLEDLEFLPKMKTRIIEIWNIVYKNKISQQG